MRRPLGEKAEPALADLKTEPLLVDTDGGFGCFANRCVNVEEVAAAKPKSMAMAARILRERHG